MIGGEATIDYLNARVAELEQERDQLAAHVERIAAAWNSGIEEQELFSDAWIDRMGDAMAADSTTNLASRDLIKQAEALEDALLVNCNKGKSLRKEISHRARNLRQQAEALT